MGGIVFKKNSLININLVFFIDKNPALSEFITQIKNTPELLGIYEFLLKDSTSVVNQDSNLMDIS